MVFVEIVKVIGLHDHVVEFKEGKTLFHALTVAFSTKHVVYREACAYLSQKAYIVEREQPVGVVQHLRFSLAEFDKT